MGTNTVGMACTARIVEVVSFMVGSVLVLLGASEWLASKRGHAGLLLWYAALAYFAGLLLHMVVTTL